MSNIGGGSNESSLWISVYRFATIAQSLTTEGTHSHLCDAQRDFSSAGLPDFHPPGHLLIDPSIFHRRPGNDNCLVYTLFASELLDCDDGHYLSGGWRFLECFSRLWP